MKQESELKSRWNKRNAARQGVLRKNRECAELTLPYILPPEGHTEDNPLPTPNSSIVALGIVNLASKLVLALLPPNAPFYRMGVDMMLIRKQGLESKLSDVQEALAKIEKAIHQELESLAVRVPIFEALKHLITVGNVLLYFPKKGKVQVYRLDHYTVKRDPKGNVLEILVKEEVGRETLPEDVQERLPKSDNEDLTKTVELFTAIERKDGKWRVYQEVGGVYLPESESTYQEHLCPYRPLRWSHIANEDYGRGLVEQCLGDLRSLEALSRALLEGSAASAKVIFLVDPNGITRVKKLATTPNGGFVEGREGDIAALQVAKQADLRVAESTAVRLEQRMAQTFMMTSSIQRQAERVTAEEIRTMAQDLEKSLGGVYSLLSQELQLWLVEVCMANMTKSNRLPSLPKGLFKPMITTGLEALGRGHDMAKLDELIQGLMNLGPEVVAEYLNVGEYIKRRGTNLGIDMEGLVRTEEEVQQKKQESQMMQMAQSGPAQEIIKQAGQALQQPQE